MINTISLKYKLFGQNGLERLSGQAMMTVVLFVLFLGGTSILAFSFLALNQADSSKEILNSEKSYFLSEAGLEDAIYRIKSGKQLSNEEILALDGETATTTVTATSDGRTVETAGNYKTNVRKVKSEIIDWTGVEFFYGSQIGEGGLVMGQNSRIEGIGGAAGNVYSNGPVVGDNGSTITGDVTVAMAVTEDNQARSTVCNQDQIVGQANPRIDYAQSFKPSDSKPLAKISLYIKKVGSPGDRTVYIAADSGGSPAQTSLANGTLSSSLVGTTYAWIDVVFPSPPNLINGATYWIVLDAARSASNYWVWCSDSNQGYGNGLGKYSEDWDDDPWTTITGDLNFKTYLGVGLSSISGIVVLGDARANTILNSSVCGDAYYQTIDPSSLAFVNSPSSPTCPSPLTPGTANPGEPDPPIENMPISDANITAWKDEAGCGQQPAVPPCSYSGNYNLTTDASIGPMTITGNLNMTSNNKTLTITGTVYVKGNIDVSNGSTARCSPSYGQKSCVLMSDGWIHIANNGSFQGSGQPGSYIMLLSTSQCDGSSAAPPCDTAHHNGAIDLHNQATGAIFYAGKGLINLHNGVTASELTAYKIQLENNAVVQYESGLINAKFSAGPSGGWVITEWKEIE